MQKKHSIRQSFNKKQLSIAYMQNETADPIISELLNLIQWQSTLSMNSQSIVHQTFQNELNSLQLKIKLELKKISDSKGQQQSFNDQVILTIQKYQKLKQLFAYCLILFRSQNESQKDIEKYKYYEKIDKNPKEALVNYLNEPIIFQMIFNSYLQIYNINHFTAEVIKSIYQLYEESILLYPIEQDENDQIYPVNSEFQLLNKKSINFKQLVQINEKYSLLAQKLNHKYLSFLLHTSNNEIDNSIDFKHEKEEKALKEKVSSIKRLLSKIRFSQGSYGSNQRKKVSQNASIQLMSEPMSIFNDLNENNSKDFPYIKEKNKIFWTQILFQRMKNRHFNQDQQSFLFLKSKIIQVKVLEHLNAILSSCNIISCIYNQIYPEKDPFHQFTFVNLKKLICSEFLGDHFQHKQAENPTSHFVVIFQHDQQKNGQVISENHTKLLYPSAVYKFFLFIKQLLTVETFSNQQRLLQILELKRKYAEKAQQTITNLFGLIEGKHFHCYELLMRYIKVLMKNYEFICFYKNEDEESVMENLKEKTLKMSIISQIIYELNSHYNIEPPFKLLVEIEEHHSLTHINNSSLLYRSILNEIILIRNGLKLDHFYSINQIHDIFMILPINEEINPEGNAKKKSHLYFQDIIETLAQISFENFLLPQLLRVFQAQLRLKLAIFRLQIWSCEKDIMFDKKHQNFLEFIQDHCNGILAFKENNPTLKQLIENIEELERLISLLEKEINRVKYISNLERIMLNNNIMIPQWKVQLGRQNFNTVETIYRAMKIVNPFMVIKSSMKKQLLTEMKNNYDQYLTIRLDQMCDWNPFQLLEKQQFAQIFFLVKSFENSVSFKDCLSIKKLKNGEEKNQCQLGIFTQRHLHQIKKEYQNHIKCRDIEGLSFFFENLLVLSILEVQRTTEESKTLFALLSDYRLFLIFQSLSMIDQIQAFRRQLKIMTKYHHIYRIISIFDECSKLLFDNNDLLANRMKQKMKLSSKNIKFQEVVKEKQIKKESKFNLIQKYFLLASLTQQTRLKIFKKIQEIYFSVRTKIPIIADIQTYNKNLNKRAYKMIIERLREKIINNELQSQFPVMMNDNPEVNKTILQKKMFSEVIKEFSEMNEDFLGKKEEIELFGEKVGFEMEVIDETKSKNYKIAKRRRTIDRKKAVISPHKLQKNTMKFLEEIKRRAIVEIIKETIPVRKHISDLQLEEKKMRNEIIWQTSRLQNEVIEKINEFIMMSSIDQEQSYINFKHAVNIETIKGIENVIEEQTKIFYEKKNQEIKKRNSEEENEVFVTEIALKNKKVSENKENSSPLLEFNLDIVLSHMKKIRIFSAWKKAMKESDLTTKEWKVFNVNVKKILENQELVGLIKNMNLIREQSLNQKVSCSLLEEENGILNEKIKSIKFSKLESVLEDYRKRIKE